ncbi:MAG: hypothetical protein EB084_14830, partial [Proteobacteria bacterium]|nr:hypothetical protein [Pseudomonadota bacterium]
MQYEAGVYLNADSKRYPLTHPQLRIWNTEQLCPGSGVANLTMQVTLEGTPDLDALTTAIHEAAAAFDCLWLQLERPDDETTPPVQYFTNPATFDLERVTLAADDLEAWCAAQAARPRERFDTQLFSFTLLTWQDHHGFLFVGHHAVCDGTTCDLLIGDIVRRYEAHRSGVACLPATFGSYRDFIEAEQAYKASDDCARDRAFWTAHLTPLPESPVRALGKPSYGDYAVQTTRRTLPGGPVNALITRTDKTTAYLVVKAALTLVLHRFAQMRRLAIAFVGHGRSTPALRDTGGMMVGTYATASEIDPQQGFDEMLASTAQRVRTIIRTHGAYPIDMLLREISAGGDLLDVCIAGHPDLFGTHHNQRYYSPGLQPEALVVHVNFDQPRKDASVNLIYLWRPALFTETEITRIHETLVRFIELAAANPHAPVATYPLLSLQERDGVLQWGIGATTSKATTEPISDLTRAGRSLPTSPDSPALLHAAFEHHADATPHAVALIRGHTHLTYADVDRRANRIAHALLRGGLAPEEPVAICLPRGVDAFVAALGVLKAGGAFVPLNPEHPAQRRAAQMRLAGARTLIDTHFIERLSATLPSARPCVPIHPLQTAYIIFTSGSTGEPKGASISHSAVCNSITGERATRGLRAAHCVLQVAALTFDA